MCTGLTATQCEAKCTDPAQTLSFCGVCDDGMSCEEIPALTATGQASCEASVVCILNNGTRIITASEQACRNFATCSERCPMCTQSECLAADQYVCSDSTDLSNGIWAGSYSGLDGMCNYKIINTPNWQPVRKCFGWTEVCTTIQCTEAFFFWLFAVLASLFFSTCHFFFFESRGHRTQPFQSRSSYLLFFRALTTARALIPASQRRTAMRRT